MAPPYPKVFLLSPARASGPRAQMLLNPSADFDVAVRLRRSEAMLAEVFTFISGLYFRGKVTYAERFGSGLPDAPSSMVITPGRGLLAPNTPISIADFLQMAEVPIDLADHRYLSSLQASARELNQCSGPNCRVVLLGSIATAKYVDPLLSVFGDRLMFPAEFTGRGDMSRGGLLLRSARSGAELTYTPVAGAVRHGPRPPRLPRLYPAS